MLKIKYVFARLLAFFLCLTLFWVTWSIWLKGPKRRILTAKVPSNIVEAEQLGSKNQSENMKCVVQKMSSFSEGKWSGDQQLFCFDSRPGDALFFTLERNQGPSKNLYVNLSKAPDYGVIAIYMDGRLAKRIDLFSIFVTNEVVDLGHLRANRAAAEIEFRVEGSNQTVMPNSYFFGLDGFWWGPPSKPEDYLSLDAVVFRHRSR